MTTVRFFANDGTAVLVEADETSGVDRIARGADSVIQATERLEEALASARATVVAARAAMGGLGLEDLSLEFGIRLSAEAGAVIAKTSGEAHLTITATWRRPTESLAPKPG